MSNNIHIVTASDVTNIRMFSNIGIRKKLYECFYNTKKKLRCNFIRNTE